MAQVMILRRMAEMLDYDTWKNAMPGCGQANLLRETMVRPVLSQFQ
jgi:hypothetical protein